MILETITVCNEAHTLFNGFYAGLIFCIVALVVVAIAQSFSHLKLALSGALFLLLGAFCFFYGPYHNEKAIASFTSNANCIDSASNLYKLIRKESYTMLWMVDFYTNIPSEALTKYTGEDISVLRELEARYRFGLRNTKTDVPQADEIKTKIESLVKKTETKLNPCPPSTTINGKEYKLDYNSTSSKCEGTEAKK